MAYTMSGELIDTNSLIEMKEILISNGWTINTAICTIIFSLMHWPCSTTCLTIYKETKSIKWTLVSILLPTLCGIIICMAVTGVFNIFA